MRWVGMGSNNLADEELHCGVLDLLLQLDGLAGGGLLVLDELQVILVV